MRRARIRKRHAASSMISKIGKANCEGGPSCYVREKRFLLGKRALVVEGAWDESGVQTLQIIKSCRGGPF